MPTLTLPAPLPTPSSQATPPPTSTLFAASEFDAAYDNGMLVTETGRFLRVTLEEFLTRTIPHDEAHHVQEYLTLKSAL